MHKTTGPQPSILTEDTQDINLVHSICVSSEQQVGWLVVFYVPSTARSFRNGTPHLLSLTKNVKHGKYTVPTGSRTPGHSVAAHYATVAPCKLHCEQQELET